VNQISFLSVRLLGWKVVVSITLLIAFVDLAFFSRALKALLTFMFDVLCALDLIVAVCWVLCGIMKS
jgi:hypothetical protein